MAAHTNTDSADVKTNGFTIGQRIYDREGRAAQFVMYLPTRNYEPSLVVQPFFKTTDGDETMLGIDQWHEAWGEPPVAVTNERVSELLLQVEKSKADLADVQGAIEERQKELAALTAARVEAMRSLDAVHTALVALGDRIPGHIDAVAKLIKR